MENKDREDGAGWPPTAASIQRQWTVSPWVNVKCWVLGQERPLITAISVPIKGLFLSLWRKMFVQIPSGMVIVVELNLWD